MPPRWRIESVDTTTSTNDDLRRAAEAGEAEGLVITAARQSAGRGRQGRVWESPEGNLYCSALLRPSHMPQRAGLYSFVAALAVRDVVAGCLQCSPPPCGEGLGEGGVRLGALIQILKQLPQHHPPLPNPPRKGEGTLPLITLKWPNDVLVHGKKISGILLEVAGDALIVGIGVNVAHYPENALYPATSLREVLEGVESSTLLAGLMRQHQVKNERGLVNRRACVDQPPPSPPASGGDALGAMLDLLLTRLGYWHDVMESQGFGPIRSAWLEQAQTGPLTVRLPQETLNGSFAGLDENGALRLRLEDGAERVISTGDVVLPPKD